MTLSGRGRAKIQQNNITLHVHHEKFTNSAVFLNGVKVGSAISSLKNKRRYNNTERKERKRERGRERDEVTFHRLFFQSMPVICQLEMCTCIELI